MPYFISETSASRPHAIKTLMGPPITRQGNQLRSDGLKLKPAPWWVSTRLRTTLSSIVLCFAQIYDLSSHSIELLTACLVLSTSVCKCKWVLRCKKNVSGATNVGTESWPSLHIFLSVTIIRLTTVSKTVLYYMNVRVKAENVIYILAPQMLLLQL